MDTQRQPAGGQDAAAAPLKTDLQEDAIGLLGATMQAITHISPAIAAFFFTQFVIQQAGITAPLAYVAGFLIVLLLGNTLIQLSKHLPSAGGYYTYVSRAVSPRAGFLTSWMFILYSPIASGPVYAFFGFILQNELKSNWNIDIPYLWLISVLVFAPLIAYFQYRGLKLSAEVLLITGGLEMLIVLALALTGFVNPGPGGVTLSVFDPGKIPAFEGFALAVVFSVQGLTGWEAAAPLAEETANPRRNVPGSVLLSIILIGVFLVIVFWGVISGYGSNNIAQIQATTELPALELAHKLWGAGWVLILFAFLNSVIGNGLACANVSTRMWYGMARSGSFPKALAKTHETHKTPVNAILMQMALSLGIGIIPAVIWGADVSFFFVDGLILVLGVTVVYVMANLAVFLFYRGEHRGEFNPLLHFVFPLIGTVVLLYAVYKSFPTPAGPYWMAPIIDGIWLLVGIGLLFYLRARGDEEWLLNAGKAIGEA
ncbi:MAG TPA: APC family permease [Candidatus Limnocylindrales bacterium]